MSSVVAARENLRTAREVIPREAWQALNDLYLYATSHHTEAVDRRSRGPLPRQGRSASASASSASCRATMSRDEAYQMLRLGRHIERADMTSRVLDVRAVALLAQSADDDEGAAAHDEVQWAAVLRSLSGLQAYHRRRRGPATGHPTVTFLLRDPDFPGSIAHCLAEVETVVGGLPRSEAVDMAARSAMRTLVTVANGSLERAPRRARRRAGGDRRRARRAAGRRTSRRPPEEPTTIDVRDDEFGPGAEARTE